MKNKKRKAVFFDRDGVIFYPVKKSEDVRWKEKGKVRAPFSHKEFLDAGGVVPCAEDVIRSVKDAGFLAILATNQPDVKYGYLNKGEWKQIHAHAACLPFDDIYVCFHGRDDGCECKKPKPEMLLEAARKWNINLMNSYFIGDTESDTGAAKAAGCKSILIDTWYNKGVESNHNTKDLNTAAKLVLELS